MKNIAVFCGSSIGNGNYKDIAHQLGRTLAQNGLGVVYGGAKVGLMGAVADGALAAGGTVTGVLPKFLQRKEIAHDSLTQLMLVETMHQRKTLMNDLSDGVIVLPGGFGTLEEMFEMLTWAQLGLHRKPIGILNSDGFFDHLIAFMKRMMNDSLLRTDNFKLLLVSDQIDPLLQQMKAYKPPAGGKWISKEKT